MIIDSQARRLRYRLSAATFLCCAAAAGAGAKTLVPPPVDAVVEGRLTVTAAPGTGIVPLHASQDWARPLPAVRRAVVIVHGYQRNAADYARVVEALVPDPEETLVLTPQFLAEEDLPDAILHWRRDLWSSGWPAEAPVPLSAFDVLDAILARLADRGTLPNLSQLVLAGFSAGGQLVQRYAEVGRGEATIAGGIALRYVVGSPSSYAYFGDERPQGDRAAPFAGAAQCPGFNRWKYGFAGDLPRYVVAAAKDGVPTLERRYLDRDVVYLVGAEDNDPNHRFLDTSCAAEAQGPTRLARTLGFYAVMRQRHGEAFRQRVWTIAGAAHNAGRVFGSPCGRAALFGNADCSGIASREGQK